MLQFSLLTTVGDLDKTIASYGIAEELSQNKAYLSDSIALAREVAGSSVCYVTMIDSSSQYIITASGMKEFPLLREESICQFTVGNRQLTIIQDISCDKRTCHLDVSKGEMTYYAGFPLINTDNIAIGTLCIMDMETKNLSLRQIKILELIARGIVEKFDTRRQLIKLIKDINKSFKPAVYADFNCLSGELAHLQAEVLETKRTLESEREKLRVSNSNLTQFAHRIAHDIKAPLRSINSFTQLIHRKSDGESNGKGEEYYQYINSSIEELDRMVDNLLNIAEFKTNVNPEAISISEIVNKIEILLFESLKVNKVTLIKPTVDVQVFGYETLLKQLFQNIISNGIKYCDVAKESFVKVSFELLESSVLVSIADNGIGISKEDLRTIFDPFKRVANNQKVEGFGIGLDTCKVIVNDMGKELIAESELGKGTIFSFEIPLK